MIDLNERAHVGRRRAARAPKLRQLTLHPRGEKRPGAGRKPKGPRALVSHKTRLTLARRFPVLVTTRLRPGFPSLRRSAAFEVLRAAFSASIGCTERHGLRLVHFSIQSNHLHLIVEARDESALARGMQGLLVRIARGLNRVWKRRGSVFLDRYHAHVLRTPREVRNALSYVLNNARKHGCRVAGTDPFSSGAWFDSGFEAIARSSANGCKVSPRRIPGRRAGNPTNERTPPLLPARTWLLSRGWRRHGPIAVWQVPDP